MSVSPTIADLRSVKIERLIVIKRGIGAGNEEEPYRIITEVFDTLGRLVARCDPIKEEDDARAK